MKSSLQGSPHRPSIRGRSSFGSDVHNMGRDSRRPTQPLDISTATTSDTPLVDPSSSPSIVKTPKSPRSPFRFSSKLQNFSTQQPMQGPEHQQKPGRQPASRTIETSASSLNSASASPVKGSLFTSYKGSNNTTNSKPASMMNNDSDARTNEGSVTPGKVSGADDGKTPHAWSVYLPMLTLRPRFYCCQIHCP